jgi:hypothetical protein
MMAIRTTPSSVTFTSPFRLKGFSKTEPPGTYRVETDEEIIEGNERTVYRRVATLLFLVGGGTTRTVTVDPVELDAAVKKDREPNSPQ